MNKTLLFDEDRKYSLNKIIRLLTGFPADMPLPCRYEHGHTPFDDKPINDLRTKKRLMLVYNKRRLAVWQKYSKKKALIIGSPFVQYRRLMKIERVAQPQGTIAFPFHSAASVEGVFDRQEYCRSLKELPSEFHPIKVCVHEHDVHRGYDSIFRDNGFEVVTAGVRESEQFVDNFYELLRQCKYATSNAFGSYIFYAVEMGVPFFIYGPEAYSIHRTKRGDTELQSIKDHEYGRYIEELFSTYPDVELTQQQIDAVIEEVGVNDAVDFKELNSVLMRNAQRQRIEDIIRLPLRHPKKFITSIFRSKEGQK